LESCPPPTRLEHRTPEGTMAGRNLAPRRLDRKDEGSGSSRVGTGPLAAVPLPVEPALGAGFAALVSGRNSESGPLVVLGGGAA
jgi:hypothetical protein